jgi:thiol:disulfide interchange protein DsbC
MKRWKAAVVGILALCVPLLSHADAASVKKLIQKKLPRLAGQVESVAPANVLGLYEIYTDERQILYTDEGVNFLFAGDILDTRDLRNLTNERLKVLGAIKLDSLPLDLAMKQVKGNGKRKLVVFSDPDCPFCRRLEKEMTDITDVTIYTFYYPIASLHPQAPEHAESIWCSADRVKAWDDYLLRNVAPEKKHCKTPLDAVQALGKKYRINGTPTLIFADGQVVPGVMPKDDLEETLGAH